MHHILHIWRKWRNKNQTNKIWARHFKCWFLNELTELSFYSYYNNVHTVYTWLFHNFIAKYDAVAAAKWWEWNEKFAIAVRTHTRWKTIIAFWWYSCQNYVNNLRETNAKYITCWCCQFFSSFHFCYCSFVYLNGSGFVCVFRIKLNKTTFFCCHPLLTLFSLSQSRYFTSYLDKGERPGRTFQ